MYLLEIQQMTAIVHTHLPQRRAEMTKEKKNLGPN
jgi:hypothetical protein